jgi:hypothetical protein
MAPALLDPSLLCKSEQELLDRARVAQALESVQPDQPVLTDILNRHQLLTNWDKMVS